MTVGRPRVSRSVLLALLALWGIGPLLLMIVHSLRAGVPLTGADGPVAADVLQYLAWVRDASGHGLAANLFDLARPTHVWLHPMFSLSGLAVWLGAGVIAAYLAWTPVAVGALFAAAVQWVRELIDPGPARLVALALVLFLNNPLRALIDANAANISRFDSQLVQATSEPFNAGLLWGYLPTVIAIALMPVCLVASASALRAGGPSSGYAARRSLARAALAALLASWLHPWQGVALILILAGAWAWERQTRELWLAVPVAAGLVPLAYYAALGHYDAAWRTSRNITEHFPHFSAGVLLLGLGPLLLLAATGLRRTGGDLLERSLVVWPVAAIAAYFVVPFPSHALEGISFPLAVLTVRGWQRLVARSALLRTMRLASAAGAVLAVAFVTVPGVVVDARDFDNRAHTASEFFYLRPDERRALDYVAAKAPAGGVVAPLPLATAIPARTGRAVWVGHSYWTPDFDRRAIAAEELFGGTLDASDARTLVAGVREQGARLLVADCAHHGDLAALLGPEVRAVHRFGCAAVYLL